MKIYIFEVHIYISKNQNRTYTSLYVEPFQNFTWFDFNFCIYGLMLGWNFVLVSFSVQDAEVTHHVGLQFVGWSWPWTTVVWCYLKTKHNEKKRWMQLFWYQLSLLEPCRHLKMADEGAAGTLVTTLKDLTMAEACNMLSWTVEVHHPRHHRIFGGRDFSSSREQWSWESAMVAR